MSKRKKKKSSAPNLPQEALERARRQARGEEIETPEAEEEEEAPQAEAPQPEPQPEAPRRSAPPRATSRRNQTERAQVRRRSKEGPLDNETLEDMLANPTKIVSEEELRGEYNYVVKDIRNMGILAATLFVVLVILAQFI